MTEAEIREAKGWIDDADYESLLYRWRHAECGHPWFVTAEVSGYYQRRMKIMREADPAGHVAASKRAGW